MFYEFSKPETSRDALLQQAFFAMYEQGYTRMSIVSLCREVGVTKGAFFHYFPTKKEIAIAVIKEILVPIGFKAWLKPLQKHRNPVQGLLETVDEHRRRTTAYEMQYGCAFQNFVQELSSLDDDFRKLLKKVFDAWTSAIADAIGKGQSAGFVRPELEPRSVALQVLSLFYGAITLGKSFRSKEEFSELLDQLAVYVSSLALSHSRIKEASA
jgi:TetR/AcrR family transcriptional regulator, transcriptional repressor for nem operon